MECKKCGAVTGESDLYCSQCGERLDGKKQCPACKNYIKEDAVFCPCCGKRVDGKTVCSKCGAVYEGNFCSVCGEKRCEKVAETSAKKKSAWEKFKKIESYLTPSLALGALFVLFVCSFFVGFTLHLEASGEAVSGGLTTIDFFGTAFDNLDAQLKSFKDILTAQNFKIAETYIKMPYIIIAVVVGINLAVCTAMLAVASVKVGIGFSKKKEVQINGFLSVAFACFFITSVIAFSAVAVANIWQVIVTTMSAGSIAGLIISGIIIIATAVLRKLALGRSGLTGANICKTICLATTIIISIITAVLAGKNFIKANESVQGANMNFNFATSAYLQLVVVLLTETSAKPMQIKSIMTPSIISHIICLASLVCLGVLLWFSLSALFKEQPKKGRISVLIVSILTMVSLIALLIMSLNGIDLISAIFTKLNIKISLRTVVIAPLVLSVIMVATAIVNAVGSRGKELDQTE